MIQKVTNLRSLCGKYELIVDLALTICQYLKENTQFNLGLADILNAPTVFKKTKVYTDRSPSLTVIIWQGNERFVISCLFIPYGLPGQNPSQEDAAVESVLTSLAYADSPVVFDGERVKILRITSSLMNGRLTIVSSSTSQCQTKALVKIAKSRMAQYIN